MPNPLRLRKEKLTLEAAAGNRGRDSARPSRNPHLALCLRNYGRADLRVGKAGVRGDALRGGDGVVAHVADRQTGGPEDLQESTDVASRVSAELGPHP